MEILILIISFLIFLILRIPIAYSIGLSALVTLCFSIPSLASFTVVAQRMATGLDSFSLIAIPFFIFAGELMNKGGIAKRLIDLAKSLVGSFPGGLAYVNIIACMLFGAVSGSAVAAASAIGGIMGGRMKKEGYDEGYSAAVNITSSTTGLLIPPSNVLIVYSLASGGTSIAALFIAGYLPGILIGFLLMLVAGIYAYKKKYPTGAKAKIREIIKHFFKALPSLLLLVVVVGGIVAGIFTATEASAVAVLYALILSFIYKEITLQELPEIILKSVGTTSIVMLLVAASMSMSWTMSYENLPQAVTEMLMTISDNKIVVLLVINLILLGVGIFMDITPAVLIFTPIFLPIVTALGIDPVHFGIMMILNLSIGLCTPPVGSVLFVGCSVAELSISRVIKPLMPLFLIMIFGLLLITYIPEITLWLPEWFGF